MEVGAVKRDIKSNTLRKFYIFTGAEIEAQRIYINKIADTIHRDIVRIDSVSTVYKQTKSLLSRPKLFVCRDDKDFLKAEKAWEDFTDTDLPFGDKSVLGDNMLILLITDIDKRSKFYKHFSGDIVEFNYMKADTLKKYILRQLDLSDYWLDTLISVCESDYSRILLEIDKVKKYRAALGMSDSSKSDKVLCELLDCGAIHTPPQDAIFDWCDAILTNKPKQAFELLEECKKIGEPALRLILVLYNNVKKTLQVQSCESKDIEQTTGLSAWDVKCVRDFCYYWSHGDLVYFMRLLRRVEIGIKSGEIDEDDALDYIMVHIF